MNGEITILTIDDDEQICFALNELFKFQGWRSCSACSVEEGICAFKKNQPDIILIDYHMPRVSGVEGVKRIRKLNAEIPIIVFTIDESQEVANTFLDAGATDFALKPIKAPDIVSRIKLHLRLLEKGIAAQNTILEKGLGQGTLDLITEYLKMQTDYKTANDIADGTGLAYKTVYRYLQYLTREKKIEMLNIYGKVGRPKQVYKSK